MTAHHDSGARRRLHLIACEILLRELSWCIARSRNVIDVTWLPKGLHDIGHAGMAARLQEAIDAVDVDRCDAIILGYALCSHGVCGLRAPVPLVVPRAHDCIALLLGSHERYQRVFDAEPGTYYESPGWMERNTSRAAGSDRIQDQLGLTPAWDKLVAEYGEDNARYIRETMGMCHEYSRLLWIDPGLGDDFADYRATVRDQADARGWRYEETAGDLAWLQRLCDGPWDDTFVIAEPGMSFRPQPDGSIIGCTRCQGAAPETTTTASEPTDAQPTAPS